MCSLGAPFLVPPTMRDFERATVTILHLKTRIRLSCPECKARLGKRHQFCPECGRGVSEARKRQQEHRRIRVLPIDKQTLKMIRDCLRINWLNCDKGFVFLFNLNRHRAWQIVGDCAGAPFSETHSLGLASPLTSPVSLSCP